MDIFLVIVGFVCVIVGVMGSIVPVLPGLPISWVGLLLAHLTSVVPMDYTYLGIWLAVAILVLVLDYVIPAMGTKKYGGSKYGVWGTTIGLIVGMFFPPIGFIVGPFLGAYIGEMVHQKDSKIASRIGLFIWKVAQYWDKFI